MTLPAAVDAIIVGAGVSGLTTAYRLMRQGWRVQVFEAADRPGGSIGSNREQEFLWESGPNSALNTTPLISQLVHDLGIADQYLDANTAAKKRYIVRNGQLSAIPYSPFSMLTTPVFSLRAKLALLREPFVPRGDPQVEESVSHFVQRRLGREFLDYAIEPFVAGIYAGDPDALSLPAAFPRLQAAEQRYGSLIRAQLFGAYERSRRKEVRKDKAHSFSFRNGMQTLTDALASSLPPLALNAPVQTIERAADGWINVSARQGEQTLTCRAKVLVLASPADQSAGLVAPFAADAAASLRDIRYAPVAILINGWRQADLGHALDGFGFLAPRVEQRRILGTLFSSSMFNERAPDGHALLTTFIGGLRQPALASAADDELIELVQQEHNQLLAATGQPQWHRLVRHQRAIPQYTMGHPDRLRRADAARAAMPGLFYCANWRGGVSLADCVKAAHTTADEVTAFLQQTA